MPLEQSLPDSHGSWSMLLCVILALLFCCSCEESGFNDGTVTITQPKTGTIVTEGDSVTFTATIRGAWYKGDGTFVENITKVVWQSDTDGLLKTTEFAKPQSEVTDTLITATLSDGVHRITCISYDTIGSPEGEDRVRILVQENWADDNDTDDGDDDQTTTSSTTTTMFSIDCGEYEDTCWDNCAAIETEASAANCDTFGHYSGCALDFVGCGTICLDYTQYWCDIPGYVACLDPIVSDHYDCVEACNAQVRATPDWGERLGILGTCGADCSDENSAGCLCVYNTEALNCKNETCDAYCKSNGLSGGQWVHYSVTQGMYNACECAAAAE